MSKLTKHALKSIVKECLIELLAEGLVGKTPSSSRKSSKKEALRETILRQHQLNSGNTSSNHAPASQARQKSYLDNISFGNAEEAVVEDQSKKIQERVSRVTSDPILSEMLADTAMTTLASQDSAASSRSIASHSNPPADAAARVVQSTPLEDLFGDENAGKWASLAFGG